ncbi:MAG: ankyrin repeat domain-containing protein [Prosthecobacter sp.]|nr:ankyrin repeat domain-containing protein [Prosthecobacter sp.]
MSEVQPQRLLDDHPIFEACKIGDVDAVERYLKAGVSVYAESEHNPTIASIATHHKHTQLLDLLAGYGLEFSCPFNRFGEPLIFIAVRAGDIGLIDYFLCRGVDPNIQDNFGGTPIKIAAGGGKVDVVKFLAGQGVDVLDKRKLGATPFREASRNNQIEVMEVLWLAGADVNEPDDAKVTPLIGCAKGGKLEAVQWLLDHGADINAKDGRGKTALQWAETNRHVAVAELLRQRGVE